MSRQHKITIRVQPRRRYVNINLRGYGNVLRLDLAGYEAKILEAAIPTTSSQKAYITAIFDLLLPVLE